MDKSSEKYLWFVVLSHVMKCQKSQANLHTQRDIQDGGILFFILALNIDIVRVTFVT